MLHAAYKQQIQQDLTGAAEAAKALRQKYRQNKRHQNRPRRVQKQQNMNKRLTNVIYEQTINKLILDKRIFCILAQKAK